MDDRLTLAHQLNDPTQLRKGNCFIGFDGFTDEILDAVDRRESSKHYHRMDSMVTFGKRIVDAAGKSCNIELVPRRIKIGGQAPILTRALMEGGHAITLVGLLGDGAVEPVFGPLAERVNIVSLGPSSQTLAVEFPDGKVMLGKHKSVQEVTWEALLAAIPLQQLIAAHQSLDLFVSGNWTMLPGINEIWRGILDQVTPELSKRPRWMYVDLADPAKRSDADLQEGLQLLGSLMNRYRVVLGLNVAEALRIGEVCGLQTAHSRQGVGALGQSLRTALRLEQVVIHAINYATAATPTERVDVDGPGCSPIITTGGGDNFNAGYCHALLNDWSTRQALLCGVAVSGFYVNQGHSPSMSELAQFFRLWHDRGDGLSAALPSQYPS